MNKFKISDICVLCNIPESNYNFRFNGEEVVITGLPGCSTDNPECYTIKGRIDAELEKGKLRWIVKEYFLKPKGDEDNLESILSKQQLNKTVSWDECSWRPRELVE